MSTQKASAAKRPSPAKAIVVLLTFIAVGPAIGLLAMFLFYLRASLGIGGLMTLLSFAYIFGGIPAAITGGATAIAMYRRSLDYAPFTVALGVAALCSLIFIVLALIGPGGRNVGAGPILILIVVHLLAATLSAGIANMVLMLFRPRTTHGAAL